jgi:hypothetical protein
MFGGEFGRRGSGLWGFKGDRVYEGSMKSLPRDFKAHRHSFSTHGDFFAYENQKR